ncbi:MAG: aminotransferase class I/II-fold pyridoxal phosphate-dependent enzyme, partial [Muribaculaceae bacterium]|nr:aminotransferase class I/II-fold pyridoxal phosphate-dependent enzyme [Muribaculaceae bacterium]
MNFDEIIPRKSTNSYKWDSDPETDNLLPMWVADMDFKTAPAVIEALRQRVDHGIFGYTKVPDEYYQAITHWFYHRHDWKINPEHIIYTTGVVPALSSTIKGLTDDGDKVIVQSPVYNLFFTSIRNNRCSMLDNCLTAIPGQPYEIDFDGLEGLAGEAKLMILCNPHNPIGRIWSADELKRIARICADYGVTVIADEIHCELTYDTPYVPFAPIAEEVGCRYVILNSPSKAFNTAGLQIANIICPDRDMRWKIDRAINDNEVCDVNPFGVVGLI